MEVRHREAAQAAVAIHIKQHGLLRRLRSSQ